MSESFPRNEDPALELSPWDFDRSPDGWRKYDPSDRPRAAALIREYVARNGNRIANPAPGERKASLEVMNFHIGQLLASAGDEERKAEAIGAFRKAFFEGQECWNAYVAATIGFLEGDEGKIDEAIRTIEASKEEDKGSGNLPILRNFKKALQMGVRDYTKPYSWPREEEGL